MQEKIELIAFIVVFIVFSIVVAVWVWSYMKDRKDPNKRLAYRMVCIFYIIAILIGIISIYFFG